MKGTTIATAIFASLPVAYAQELTLTILGRPFSLIVLVPFVLIILSASILIYLQLKKQKMEIMALLHSIGLILISLSRYLKETRLGAMARELKKLLHRRKQRITIEQKEKDEEIIHEEIDYLAELEDLEQRIASRSPGSSLQKLTVLSRKFFSYTFHLHYQFTFEELANNLSGKGNYITDYALRLSVLMFSRNKLTREEVRSATNDFRKIVKANWKKERKKKATTVIGKIVEEDKKILHTINQFIGEIKSMDKRRQLQRLLIDERMILSRDFTKVREAYKKILDIYLRLTPAERARVYPRLVEFSDRIKEFPSMSQAGKQQIEVFTKKLKEIQHAAVKETFKDKLEKKYLDITKGYTEAISKRLEKKKKSADDVAKEEMDYLSKVKEAVRKEERIIVTKIGAELDKLHEEQQLLARKLHGLVQKKKEPAAKAIIHKKMAFEVERLLREGESVLRHNNLSRARIIYGKVKGLYDGLSWGEKRQLESRVLAFYKEIIRKIETRKK